MLGETLFVSRHRQQRQVWGAFKKSGIYPEKCYSYLYMAVYNCPTCGAPISGQLTECPYCPVEGGAPVGSAAKVSRLPSSWERAETRLKRAGRILGGLAVLGAVAVFARLVLIPLGPRESPVDAKESDQAALKSLSDDVALIRERLDESRQWVGEMEAASGPAEGEPASPPPSPAPEPSLEERASAGDAEAQFQLAKAVYPEQSTAAHFDESLGWFRKAADQGHVTAQLQLGWMYYVGEGVVPNRQQALDWFQKAADQGSELARDNISAIRDELDREAWLATGGESQTAAGLVPVEEETAESEVAGSGNGGVIELPGGVVIPADLLPGSVVVVNPPGIRQEVYINNEYNTREEYVSYQPNAGFYGRNVRARRDDPGNPSSPRGNQSADRPSRYDNLNFVTPRTGRLTPYTGRITPLSRGVTPLSGGVTPLGSQ